MTTAEKTDDRINAFEQWVTPHLLAGKLMLDVTLAYTQAYPGRSIGLIMALYDKLNAAESQLNMEEIDGSN